MESISPSQPESYRQLLRQSLYLYRRSFNKIILLSFLMSMIVFIPRLMTDLMGHEVFSSLDPLSWQQLWFIPVDIVALIFFIAIIWHTYCAMRAKHEPFIQDFQVGIRKVFYVFIASLIQSMVIFAFSLITYSILARLSYFDLLFIQSLLGVLTTVAVFLGQAVLLLYLSTLFIFVMPLIAIENKGILKAIEKSFLLGWRHGWRIFSTQITPWLFYAGALVILKYLLNIDVHIYFTKKIDGGIGTTLLNIVLFTLFIPWVSALLVTQLKDLELRKQLAPKRQRTKRKK